MRKLLIVMFACILFGCSKEEDEFDSRLVGTKWQTEDVVYEWTHDNEVAFRVYEFTSGSKVKMYTTQNDIKVADYGSYKYTLNYPNLSIVMNDSTIYDYTFVDTRSFTNDNLTSGRIYYEYIKK